MGTVVFHVFLSQFWCPMVSPATAPGLATGIRPGRQPSPQMSAWRVWRYIGMMQYDLRRLDATSLQWQDWCCCWMNSDMRWFKESTLPEYIRFQWLSWHVIYSMPWIFSTKAAPGFGISQMVWEHSMPSGGERQALQNGQRRWRGGHLGRGHQELRGHSLNMLELLGSEATRNIGFQKEIVAIIWRLSTQHRVYTL